MEALQARVDEARERGAELLDGRDGRAGEAEVAGEDVGHQGVDEGGAGAAVEVVDEGGVEGVERGVLVVVTNDGRAERRPMIDVMRVAIEQ